MISSWLLNFESSTLKAARSTIKGVVSVSRVNCFNFLVCSCPIRKGSVLPSDFLTAGGVENRKVLKISEGTPNVLDLMREKAVDLIINTPTVGKKPKRDGYMIRCSAVDLDVPYITTIAGAQAAVNAIDQVRNREIEVKSWNEYFGR